MSDGISKIIIPALIKKPPNQQTEDQRVAKMNDTQAIDKQIFYKVPVAPLITLNFTTNPNVLVKNKKDKKKSKPARSKKNKKTKFEGIPFPKDNSCLLPRKVMIDLSTSVIHNRIKNMKQKYELDSYMFTTEPILRWDLASNEDPHRYLDFLKEIEEELVKYEPYKVPLF